MNSRATDVPIPDDRGRRDGLGRRVFLASAAAGAFALTVGSASVAHAVTFNPIPKLPDEISRLANQVTPAGTPYDNIEVSINGDKARIFVPQSRRPYSKTAVGAIWYFHATGSTHSSLNGAFKYSAELAVDQGGLSICQNLGGTLYTNPIAQQAQLDGVAYLRSIFNVAVSFLRANSGGGAMACWAYGNKMIPYTRGLYMANSLYDVEERYAAEPDRIGPAYGYDEALMAANNPARLASSAWTGTRIRVVVSDEAHPDPVIPQDAHGLALIASAAPVARETTVRTHDLGHQVPSWANKDMIATFGRWLNEGP